MGVMWAKIGEGVVRYWPLTNSFFLLGVLTFVPILVKINQEMRQWECSQTDRYTHATTDAKRFYNLYHAICYSYGGRFLGHIVDMARLRGNAYSQCADFQFANYIMHYVFSIGQHTIEASSRNTLWISSHQIYKPLHFKILRRKSLALSILIIRSCLSRDGDNSSTQIRVQVRLRVPSSTRVVP